MNNITDELKNAKDDLSGNLNDAKKSTTDHAKNIYNEVSDAASEAKDTLKQGAKDYSNELMDYVKKCPLKAVGIASLIGLAVGIAIMK